VIRNAKLKFGLGRLALLGSLPLALKKKKKTVHLFGGYL
jgi:hypothetical protein